MRYPIAHNQKIEEIESIVTSWPVEKSLDDVLKWLLQFDKEDIDLGVRVLKNLNVIGYEDLNTSLSVAYSKLERAAIDKGTRITSRNTLFAGVGDGAKSGAMIGYNFRLINELSEENFMTDDSILHLESNMVENVVLVDDIIGTGQQAINEIDRLTREITPFGVKNIFLLTAVEMSDGITNIASKTKAHVFSAFEYSRMDTVTNLDSPFYDDVPHERRAELRSRIEYYGKVSNKSPLGFGGVGALIAFYYNTPNISLPVIWGSNNSWIPLFRRAVKINGINSYYKQIEASLRKKKESAPITKEPPLAPKVENVFFLFVEGKTDEIFFDYVVSTLDNGALAGRFKVVSLNGFNSKRLIENTAQLSPNCIFILEDDQDAPKGIMAKWKENISAYPHLLIPPVESFFDVDLIFEDERWGKHLRDSKGERQHDDEALLRKKLRDIYKNMAISSTNPRTILEGFVDAAKLDNLKKQLIEKLTAQSEIQVN